MTKRSLSPRQPLTAERLRELLHYDPLTGIFTCRIKRRGTKGVGSIAGCEEPVDHPSGKRYWVLCLDYVHYKRGRLAWFYTHGVWPAGEIDHADGNEGNDAIDNLRDATRLQNSQNTRNRKHSKAQLKGIRLMRNRPDLKKPWNARITVHGRELCLGYFASDIEAARAYDAAALQYHGAFARTNHGLGLLP